MVLRFESTTDIAERPLLVRKDVHETANEHDVKRDRLAGEDIRQDDGGAVVIFPSAPATDAPLPVDYI